MISASALASALALAFTSAFSTPDPVTPPNFYPGFLSAREASKNVQKEMIIFFSDKTCATCEGAWVAFSKDTKATNQYISTRMDIGDFDGGVFFDLLDLEDVPSWIILLPDGTEKERWEGGWKDEKGNPTKYEMVSVQTPIKSEMKTNKSIQKTSPSPNVGTKQNSSSTTEMKADSPVHGFILQAGYFGSEMNAQNLLGELNSKEITGYEIKSIEQLGVKFYRVVSKVFNTNADIDQEQQRLASAGFKTNIKEF